MSDTSDPTGQGSTAVQPEPAQPEPASAVAAPADAPAEAIAPPPPEPAGAESAGAESAGAESAGAESAGAESASGQAARPAMTVRACGDLLRQHFPALFGGPARPLKLRIQADIQQRTPGVFSRQTLSAFLRRHTGSTAYLTAMARGGARFDLDGQAAGEVAADHREAAATEVARRRASQQARIDQEREALRQQRDAVREEREALRREQEALQREQYQAMRQRATLLHDFENTRLSSTNFCVLKGIDPARLDELLALARLEAKQRREADASRAAETRPDRPADGRGPRGDGPRRFDGPRGPGGPGGNRGPRGPGGPRGADGPRGSGDPRNADGQRGPGGPRNASGQRGPGGPRQPAERDAGPRSGRAPEAGAPGDPGPREPRPPRPDHDRPPQSRPPGGSDDPQS
jgi:sRNA-binding protein